MEVVHVHPSPCALSIAVSEVQALKANDRMPLFTALLGFDPNITLPMLEQWVSDNEE